MSLPYLTMLREIAQNILGLSLSPQINVGGSGEALWIGDIDATETVVLANGLDYVRGHAHWKNVGSGLYRYMEFAMSNISGASATDGVNFSLDSGDFKIYANTSGDISDVTVSFVSSPPTSSGLVGPRGATGATGATGADGADGIAWEAWQYPALDSGWSNVNTTSYGYARYRRSVSSDVIQLAGYVQSSNISGQNQIFTLATGYRPTFRHNVAVHGDTIASGAITTARLIIVNDGRVTALAVDNASKIGLSNVIIPIEE